MDDFPDTRKIDFSWSSRTIGCPNVLRYCPIKEFASRSGFPVEAVDVLAALKPSLQVPDKVLASRNVSGHLKFVGSCASVHDHEMEDWLALHHS